MPFEVVTTWTDEKVHGRKEDHYTFESRAYAQAYAQERLTDADKEKVTIIDKDSGEETEVKDESAPNAAPMPENPPQSPAPETPEPPPPAEEPAAAPPLAPTDPQPLTVAPPVTNT